MKYVGKHSKKGQKLANPFKLRIPRKTDEPARFKTFEVIPLRLDEVYPLWQFSRN